MTTAPPKPLSNRAEKLLERVERGEFYKQFDPKLPKAMEELVQAGLVGTAGRVVLVERFYVPEKGYKPYEREVFGTDVAGHKALIDAAEDVLISFDQGNLGPVEIEQLRFVLTMTPGSCIGIAPAEGI